MSDFENIAIGKSSIPALIITVILIVYYGVINAKKYCLPPLCCI